MKKINKAIPGDTLNFFPANAEGYRGDDVTIEEIHGCTMLASNGMSFYKYTGGCSDSSGARISFGDA